MTEISLVRIDEKNLRKIRELGFREDQPEWKKWDGPYFVGDYQKYESFDDFKAREGEFFLSDRLMAIIAKEKLVGVVTKYWEDERTRWLDIGITIYRKENWNQNIGTRALSLWIDEIFKTTEKLAHIGLVTWSGNQRMIKAAQKLGMKMEARIRKVRYYQNTYYDSLTFGILREEWKNERI